MKKALKLKEIWAIRIRLQIANRVRDLAFFNLAIDSKLRGCDLVRLRVSDVTHGGRVMSRATFRLGNIAESFRSGLIVLA